MIYHGKGGSFTHLILIETVWSLASQVFTFSGILFTNFENVTLSLLWKKKVALGTLACIEKSEKFRETSGKYLTEPVHK
jgi:hypothetical protein